MLVNGKFLAYHVTFRGEELALLSLSIDTP